MSSPQHSPCPGGVCLLKEATIIFPVSQTQYFMVIFILSSNAIPFSIGLSLVPRHLHNASPVTIPVAVHTHSILAPCLTIFHVSHCYPPSVILQAFMSCVSNQYYPLLPELPSPHINLIISLSKTKKTSPFYREEFSILLKIQELSNLLLTSSQVPQNLFRARVRDRVTIRWQAVPLLYCRFLLYIYLFAFHFSLPGLTVTIFKLPNLSSSIQVQYSGATSIK